MIAPLRSPLLSSQFEALYKRILWLLGCLFGSSVLISSAVIALSYSCVIRFLGGNFIAISTFERSDPMISLSSHNELDNFRLFPMATSTDFRADRLSYAP